MEERLRTKLRWELSQTITRIHLDTIILSARSVWWLEGAVVSWAVEGDELIEAITHTAEHTAGSINKTKRPSGLATVSSGLTRDLLRHFHNTVNNVTQCTAKLAI